VAGPADGDIRTRAKRDEGMEVNDVLSVSSLIEFLLNLLRSETAKAEFVADPQGTLSRHGLDGLCGQDVRDVQPLLADHAAVHVKGADQHPGSYNPGSQSHRGHDGQDNPVHEIKHITEHYQVNNVVVHDSNQYNFTYVDDRDTIINVDDRDTTTIQADGDVTIKDSFNQDNDVTVIKDSFNQDNDGVDNKGGTINDSAVAGEDVKDSFNSKDTAVVNSFNEDNSETNIDTSDGDTAETTEIVNKDPHRENPHHEDSHHENPHHEDSHHEDSHHADDPNEDNEAHSDVVEEPSPV
jgi:hypothetical protein